MGVLIERHEEAVRILFAVVPVAEQMWLLCPIRCVLVVEELDVQYG